MLTFGGLFRDWKFNTEEAANFYFAGSLLSSFPRTQRSIDLLHSFEKRPRHQYEWISIAHEHFPLQVRGN
jgi:hypothetical protein